MKLCPSISVPGSPTPRHPSRCATIHTSSDSLRRTLYSESIGPPALEFRFQEKEVMEQGNAASKVCKEQVTEI